MGALHFSEGERGERMRIKKKKQVKIKTQNYISKHRKRIYIQMISPVGSSSMF